MMNKLSIMLTVLSILSLVVACQPDRSVSVNQGTQNISDISSTPLEDKKFFSDSTIEKFESLTCNDIISLDFLNSKFSKNWNWKQIKPKINAPITTSYDPVTKIKTETKTRQRDFTCIYSSNNSEIPYLKIGVILKEDTLDWKTFVDSERQRIKMGGIVFDVARRKLEPNGDMMRETNDIGNNYFEYLHPPSKDRTYTIMMVDSSKRFIVSFVLEDKRNLEENSKLNDLQVIRELTEQIDDNLQKISYELKEE